MTDKDVIIVHNTDHYQVELHPEDADELWYWIVNKEHGVAESKEHLKPQALVYCEQFNILIEQGTHKTVAENMVKSMQETALGRFVNMGDMH